MTKQAFQCQQCDYNTTNKSNIRRHVKGKHQIIEDVDMHFTSFSNEGQLEKVKAKTTNMKSIPDFKIDFSSMLDIDMHPYLSKGKSAVRRHMPIFWEQYENRILGVEGYLVAHDYEMAFFHFYKGQLTWKDGVMTSISGSCTPTDEQLYNMYRNLGVGYACIHMLSQDLSDDMNWIFDVSVKIAKMANDRTPRGDIVKRLKVVLQQCFQVQCNSGLKMLEEAP